MSRIMKRLAATLPLGGTLGYKILKLISLNGDTNSSAYRDKSKLAALLGQSIWDELADKTVIDFGCGEGAEAIEMARHGARKVIGLDIQEKSLKVARQRAEKAGVSQSCVFALRTDEEADVIIALDSFEHFEDPASVLVEMHRLLKPTGYVLAAFGPTWYHPLGGHLFSIFPWAHLLFTEKALIRWRADFKTDGATSFSGVAGGLNQMTIARFEKIVENSPFQFAEFEAVPIRKLRFFSNRLTREFLTSTVRCRLVPRRETFLFRWTPVLSKHGPEGSPNVLFVPNDRPEAPEWETLREWVFVPNDRPEALITLAKVLYEKQDRLDPSDEVTPEWETLREWDREFYILSVLAVLRNVDLIRQILAKEASP